MGIDDRRGSAGVRGVRRRGVPVGQGEVYFPCEHESSEERAARVSDAPRRRNNRIAAMCRPRTRRFVAPSNVGTQVDCSTAVARS